MRRWGWTVSFLLALFFLGLHSAEAIPILNLCNTGQAAGCVGALAEGSVDPNYVLFAAPAPFTPGTSKVVSTVGFPFPPWIANDADSQWIGPTAATTADSDGPVGDYTYRTTFSLAGLDPSTASISGFWSTDNAGLDILINGVSTGQSIPTIFAFMALSPFSITSGFIPGVNTLDFVLNNEGGPTGLRVDSIVGTASATPPPRAVTPVPEPTSLLLFGSGLAGIAAFRHRRRR